MANTYSIDIPFPAEPNPRLVVNTNGVQVMAQPADQRAWVTGQAIYKRPPAPTIVAVEGETTIYQEYVRSELTNMFLVSGDSPKMELSLGDDHPYSLHIDSLGDLCDLKLGGLPLLNLYLDHKMGQMSVDFAAPNPQPLAEMRLRANAARYIVNQLGQARAATIFLQGNASTFSVEWGTMLYQDTILEVNGKECPTTLYLPPHVAIQVVGQDDAPLGTEDIEFEIDEAFQAHQNGYSTPQAIAGETPMLTVRVTPSGPLSIYMAKMD